MRFSKVELAAYRLQPIWDEGLDARSELGELIISKETEEAIESLCRFVKDMKARERKPSQNRGRKPIALPSRTILEGMVAKAEGRISKVAAKLGVHRDTVKKRLQGA